MSYHVVDLYTCRFYRSNFKGKYPGLAAQLEKIPDIQKYHSTIDLYALQEEFGSHNPICVGDKVTDTNTQETSSGDGINIFEVLDVQYGITIDTEGAGKGAFLDLHPKICEVFRGAKRISPAPPPASDSEITPGDEEEGFKPNGAEDIEE